MPNWANVRYVVKGPVENVRTFYHDMHDASERFVEDEGGWKWLGSIFEKYHGMKRDNKDFPYSRGGITDMELNDTFFEDLDGTGIVTIDCECAWGEMNEWRKKIEELYKVKIYFNVVEEGNLIFESNDVDHEFFDDYVYIYFENAELDDTIYTIEEMPSLMIELRKLYPDAGFCLDDNFEKASEKLEKYTASHDIGCYSFEKFVYSAEY